jgi:hypothetical protein
MGIKRRMSIFAKNSYLLFANRLKMYIFLHLHSKFSKKCYFDPKFFYPDFKFVDADSNKCS